MARYFLVRLGWSIVAILAIVVINFLIIHLVPGDPVQALVGEYPVPADYVERVRREFGLDQPLPIQLWHYLLNIVHGNLGFSFSNRQSVADVILYRASNTLLLMAPAMALSIIIGIALALASAGRPRGKLDSSVTVLTLFGYSLPVFWFGQVLVLIFVIMLGILPAAGMHSLRLPPSGWGATRDLLWHMVLPGLCIMAFKVAVFARSARASIISATRSDFIMTARAKGLGRQYILWRHVLPNAMIPIIAVFGYQFGHALTSSLLVETVFAWPGIGQLFITAIAQRDFPVLQGILLASTVFVVIANLLADVLYTIVDPRIRGSLGGHNA
jgi:peptide/nickel transport system permease protein